MKHLQNNPVIKGAALRLGRAGVAGMLVLTLVSPMVVFPSMAKAVVPVVETGPSLIKTIFIALKSSVSASANVTTAGTTGVSAAHDTTDSLNQFVLKPLALALGRAAIQSITSSTVNWINGGFQGSPAFATDLKTNLRQLGDGIASQFLLDLSTNAHIDSPFVDSLVHDLGTAYYLYSGRDALRARLQDTLSQNSANPAAFRSGNFSEGGWNAFFSTYANDANNPVGAHLLASQAMSARISAAAEARVQELSWGSGFLSWRGDCIRSAQTSTTPVPGDTTAQPATVPTDLSDKEGCLEHEIQTPGSFFENKLNVTTDSPLHQLELAQSIDAIVGALAQQLISKALGGGGLRSASDPSQGGGYSQTTQGTNNGGGGLITPQQGLSEAIATSITQITAWKNDSQVVLSAAQLAKGACVNNPSAIEDPITPAIDTATSAVQSASSLLTSLTKLAGMLSASPTATNAPTNTTYLETASAYQALSLPSAATMQNAATDAKKTGGSVAPSLYSQLILLSSNGCVLDTTPQVSPQGGSL